MRCVYGQKCLQSMGLGPGSCLFNPLAPYRSRLSNFKGNSFCGLKSLMSKSLIAGRANKQVYTKYRDNVNGR